MKQDIAFFFLFQKGADRIGFIFNFFLFVFGFCKLVSALGCILKETHDNSALHEMNFSNQDKIFWGGVVCVWWG